MLFVVSRTRTGFCAVGSVKTNIGHTLMASAAASVVKVLLSLKHGQLPPSLHAARTSPEINFADSPFYVNRLITPWSGSRPSTKGGGQLVRFQRNQCAPGH